jgi:hypothetical protein
MAHGTSQPLGRRKFLLGATVAAAGAFAQTTQTAAEHSAGESAPPLNIIDFHNHYVGPNFPLTTLASAPPALRSYWEGINRNLSDPVSLMSSIEQSGIAARVINTPTAFLEDADGNIPSDMIPRINDAVADLVSRNPGRLYGLATVDAYAGEIAARELTRAVKELGLRGVFIESAKRDLLPDAPQARPTFATAAALGVPVFVHPVTDPAMHNRFKRLGRLGVRLARANINAAALVALIESGTLRRDTQPAGRGDDAGARRRPARRRLRRRRAAAQRYARASPAPRLHRHHGAAPGSRARGGRSARRRSRAGRHRLADCGGAVGARPIADSIECLRAQRGAAADGGERQYAQASRTRMRSRANGCGQALPRR